MILIYGLGFSDSRFVSTSQDVFILAKLREAVWYVMSLWVCTARALFCRPCGTRS